MGIPEFLLNYRGDFPEYEVTLALPKANTIKYNRLHREHIGR